MLGCCSFAGAREHVARNISAKKQLVVDFMVASSGMRIGSEYASSRIDCRCRNDWKRRFQVVSDWLLVSDSLCTITQTPDEMTPDEMMPDGVTTGCHRKRKRRDCDLQPSIHTWFGIGEVPFRAGESGAVAPRPASLGSCCSRTSVRDRPVRTMLMQLLASTRHSISTLCV